MSKVLGIDPGPTQSAFVVWDSKTETIDKMGIVENEWLLGCLHNAQKIYEQMVIEMIEARGMSVGKKIFETCIVIGRIMETQRSQRNVHQVYRRVIKLHFCGTMRAKKSNVRQALIDLYGEPGRKAEPGKLYGVKTHIWDALAVAVWYAQIKGIDEER